MPGEKCRLALALDATSLRNRWTILAISVLVAGCAIPVAWKVLPAEQEGSWRPHWEALLKVLGPSVPQEWEVIVLADRGLYARWLWDCILAQGWHPASRGSIWGQRRVRWAASRSSGSADFSPFAGLELARQDGVFCGQSQSAAGDRVDALGAGI